MADASGQRSQLAKSYGKKHFSKFFKKLAIWGYFDNAKRLSEPLAGNVLFQTNKQSWLWFIAIDDTTTSVGVVTPPTTYTKGQDPAVFLDAQIKGCPLI